MKYHGFLRQLVCLLLILAMLPLSALAEQSDPFALPEPLPELPFRDVPEGAWYGTYARISYALGLMQGVSSDSFQPNGSVTLHQGIAVAVRVYERYRGTEDQSGSGGGLWYE